jgi:hypothetical protein
MDPLISLAAEMKDTHLIDGTPRRSAQDWNKVSRAKFRARQRPSASTGENEKIL